MDAHGQKYAPVVQPFQVIFRTNPENLVFRCFTAQKEVPASGKTIPALVAGSVGKAFNLLRYIVNFIIGKLQAHAAISLMRSVISEFIEVRVTSQWENYFHAPLHM